ncbi:hypothetical protein CTEN210_03697 [Chaetoceros tenuissimus]|uniref:MYND-type domain-containing protein n=1 Tax=Chaetoceros tenuissimus TaxID=426638 RepID=A0AAD3H1L1_9STRA|nr:hypothetical protein CTEN210_03697 [Chaetoceros tenuissimus]
MLETKMQELELGSSTDSTEEQYIDEETYDKVAEARYKLYQAYVDRHEGDNFEQEGYYWGGSNQPEEEDKFFIGPFCTQEQTQREVDEQIQRGIFVDEDDLTEEQVVAFMKIFTSDFYMYIDKKAREGSGIGAVKSHSTVSSSSETYPVFSLNIDVLVDQCNEVKYQYDCNKSVLGECMEDDYITEITYTANAKGKNKKKNRRKTQHKSKTGPNIVKHRERIEKSLPKLICQLEQNMTKSLGSAKMLFHIAGMMSSASTHDPVIASCILSHDDGKILDSIIRLCKLAAKNAKEAMNDDTRLTIVGHMWWKSYGELTNLMGTATCGVGDPDSIRKSITNSEMLEEVLTLFKERLMPYFLPIIEPSKKEAWFCEEPMVWETIRGILWVLPRSFGAKFIKRHWDIIETACDRNIENMLKQCKIQHSRVLASERFMAEEALVKISYFISTLCMEGFEKQGMQTMVPGPLALGFLKRGAVPLLVKLSRCKYDVVSQNSVFGLANLTRLKDCRDLLFQMPNDEGIAFVKDMMTSKNCYCASNNMLLILHLSWDEEWLELLRAMEPKVENCCTKLAAFAMKNVLEYVDELKEASQVREGRIKQLTIEIARAKTDEEKTRLMDELKEVCDERVIQWDEYESEVPPSSVNLLTISRAILVLSSAIFRNRPMYERLRKTDYLELITTSLRSPFKDNARTALSCLNNAIAYNHSFGTATTPSQFSDPEYVVESLMVYIHEKMSLDENLVRHFLQTALDLLHSPSWLEIFHRVGAKNPMVAGFAMMHGRIDIEDSSRRQSKFEEDVIGNCNSGVPEKCTVNTGKLAKCQGCGKIESKRGEWKKCSRCRETVYCSRACQTSDWKIHKKICGK